MTRLVLALILLTAVGAWAGDKVIRPAIPSLGGTSLFRPGSPANPYVIRDQATGQTWQLHTELPDLDTGNDLFAPGTDLNPYVIHGEEP
jgi:hypothetical protein